MFQQLPLRMPYSPSEAAVEQETTISEDEEAENIS